MNSQQNLAVFLVATDSENIIIQILHGKGQIKVLARIVILRTGTYTFKLVFICSLLGTGVVSASGGDGACVPHCQECKEQRRCTKCESGYSWKNYQCYTDVNANEPLVSFMVELVMNHSE